MGIFRHFLGRNFSRNHDFLCKCAFFSATIAREFTHDVGNFVNDVTCKVGDTFATHRHRIRFRYIIDKVAYLVGGAIEELTAIARSADHHDALSLGWFGIGEACIKVVIVHTSSYLGGNLPTCSKCSQSIEDFTLPIGINGEIEMRSPLRTLDANFSVNHSISSH